MYIYLIYLRFHLQFLESYWKLVQTLQSAINYLPCYIIKHLGYYRVPDALHCSGKFVLRMTSQYIERCFISSWSAINYMFDLLCIFLSNKKFYNIQISLYTYVYTCMRKYINIHTYIYILGKGFGVKSCKLYMYVCVSVFLILCVLLQAN